MNRKLLFALAASLFAASAFAIAQPRAQKPAGPDAPPPAPKASDFPTPDPQNILVIDTK